MITLSRLLLDPQSRRVQNEIANPYEMHRTLTGAFPGLSDEEWKAARVLFRVDDDNDALALLVQSHQLPDWAHFATRLSGRYWLQAPQIKTWQPQFHSGQTLRFRLLANPTFRPFVDKKAKPKKNVERVGLYREHERLDWLLHRGRKEYGFDLESGPVTLRRHTITHNLVMFRGKEHEELTLELPHVDIIDLNDGRRFPLPKSSNQFSAARFDGTLCVTDSEAFTKAVENGIGSAKGFGFGLLSIARGS